MKFSGAFVVPLNLFTVALVTFCTGGGTK